VTVELEYQVTADDLRDASACANSFRRSAAAALWLCSGLLLFCGIGLLYLDAQSTMGWLATILAVVFGGVSFVREARVRGLWRRHASGLPKVHLTVNEDGLIKKTATQEVRSSWTAIVDAHEDEQCFLLYQTAVAYSVIPKRAFSGDDQLDAFRNLVGRKVTGRRWAERRAASRRGAG
jgi:hypothetical protein